MDSAAQNQKHVTLACVKIDYICILILKTELDTVL